MSVQKIAVSFVAAAGFTLLLSCSKVSEFVAPYIISDAEEIEMGAGFDREIRNNGDRVVSTNTILNRYIDSLGQLVADAQNQRTYGSSNFPFHFAVIVNDTINAFAVPGGYIYVHTGLIENAKTEEEIVGVIAHEVAHVTNGHGRETMVKSLGYDYVRQLAGLDSSLIAGSLQGLLFLKYSRGNEDEADSCAVAFIHRTQWNPKGMADFFQVLIDTYGTGGIEWLSTHPDTDDRKTNVLRIMNRTPSDTTRTMHPVPSQVRSALP